MVKRVLAKCDCCILLHVLAPPAHGSCPTATLENDSGKQFWTEAIAAMVLEKSAVKRLGQDSEIAAFVSFLAGKESGYITGASLTIDGGYSA